MPRRLSSSRYSNITCTATNRHEHENKVKTHPAAISLPTAAAVHGYATGEETKQGPTLWCLSELSDQMLHPVETEHEADEVRRHHEEDVDHTASCCYVAVP
jgi:hypothetical protein